MRRYQRTRPGVFQDQSVRKEFEKFDRWAEQVTAALSNLKQENYPGSIAPGSGTGGPSSGLQDHDHSQSGKGGATLGADTKTIDLFGTWWHHYRMGFNINVPSARLHMKSPDAAYNNSVPTANVSVPGNWVNQVGASTAWAELADASTANYVKNDPLNAGTFTVQMGVFTAPSQTSGWKFLLKVYFTVDTGATESLTIGVLNGGASLFSQNWTCTQYGTWAVSTIEVPISDVNAALIIAAGGSNIRISISAGGTIGATVPYIGYLALAAPTGSGGEETLAKFQAGSGQTLDLVQMLTSAGVRRWAIGPNGELIFGDATGDALTMGIPSAITAYSILWPSAVGASTSVLQASDGAGTLAWTLPKNLPTRVRYEWRANGPYTVGTSADGGIMVPTAFTVSAVRLYRTTAGSSSDTILDLNKNGTTMYSTAGNRPTINFADADKKVSCVLPDITAVAADDILTMDIDQKEGGTPADLVLVVEGY